MAAKQASLIMALCVVGGVSAWAQNYVDNPDFDVGVAGWDVTTEASVTYSAVDADLDINSGSARVSNTAADAGNGRGMIQCIPVTVAGGGSYEYGGMMYLPTGQDRTGYAGIGLTWYTEAGCSGSIVGDQPRSYQSTFGTWGAEDDTVVAPSGAVSVRFVAYASKAEAGGTLIAHFDNLFFRLATLFSDGFESGDTGQWSSATP